MPNKNVACITHTEILCLAIRSMNQDIERLKNDLNIVSKSDPNGLMARSMEDVLAHEMKRLDTLKTLYQIETGEAYGE